MSKKFKPYKTGNNKDIYSKRGKKQRNLENVQRHDNVKLFGFRSGKSYKMIPAILYYVSVVIYIGYSIFGEFTTLKFEPMDIVLEVFKYIFIVIAFFSPGIFLSDFKYVDNFPVFRKHNSVSGFIGILVVIAFCYGMMQIDIYCMSETYKASVEKYDEEYKKKLEEAQQQLEEQNAQQTTTVSETTISIEQ